MAACLLSSAASLAAPARRQWRCRASSLPPASHRRVNAAFVPKIQTMIMEELRLGEGNGRPTSLIEPLVGTGAGAEGEEEVPRSPLAKLYAIADAAADRAEMHAIIGEQRNNWNVLLLNANNSMILAASVMAGASVVGIGEAAAPPPQLLAFKISSALLFSAAAGLMALVNKIQPSQLAEEQRKATQLFKQLERSIRTAIELNSSAAATDSDVEEALEKVLAIDAAYPLPLLPGMLEKFPEAFEPARWWPNKQLTRRPRRSPALLNNGWSKELEEQMSGIRRVLRKKDEEQYRWFGIMFKNINKALAISGPVFCGLAAAGAASIRSAAELGELPLMLAVVGGAIAMATNTVEHGMQLGMLVEMFRNCYGFYRQIGEEIERSLGEEEVEERENGEMMELKMALKLGRSFSELRGFAKYSSCHEREMEEFAGKLF